MSKIFICNKNQILSLTCIPISPNEQSHLKYANKKWINILKKFWYKNKIPQFDLLTLGAQVFGLLISLYLFYYYSLTNSILHFIEIKKFRTKKLQNNKKLITSIENDLNYTLWLINYSYLNVLK